MPGFDNVLPQAAQSKMNFHKQAKQKQKMMLLDKKNLENQITSTIPFSSMHGGGFNLWWGWSF